MAFLAFVFLQCPLSASETETGSFDVETGLWFPPGATKDAFIDGTAPRAYPLAVRDRLSEDETLKQTVCAWLLSPRNEVPRERTGGRIAQMKTMALMVCTGIPAAREARQKMGEQEQRLEMKYRGWLDLDAARKLDRAMRAEKAEELLREIDDFPPGEQQGKLALKSIGLMPQDDRSIVAAVESLGTPSTIPGRHFARFLREVYTSKSETDDAEARRWKLGLRSLHFFSGEFPEARKITADAIDRPFLNQHDFDRVFLAILDRVLGDRRTWETLFSGCPVPAAFRLENPAGSPDHYCWTVARRIVWRGIRILGEKAPSALKEVLVEGIAAEPTNWGDRMESIRILRRVDRRLAAQEAEAVLAIPATLSPPGARYDAVWALAKIAREEKETARALGALDRYLDILGFKLPRIPPDLWSRLRAIGKLPRQEKPPASDEFDFVRWALDEKVATAAEANLVELARRTVALRLAAEFEHDAAIRTQLESEMREHDETDAAFLAEARSQIEASQKTALERAAEIIRYQLILVARACQRTGDRAGALRIVGYLYNQPNEEGPGLMTNLSSLKYELGKTGPVESKDETSPWEPAPSAVPGRGQRKSPTE